MNEAMITIRYFAGARALAGTPEEETAVPAAGLDQPALRALIAGRHPELARVLSSCRIAIGDTFAEADQRIPPGATVDILPPVAGGSGVALSEISDQPLSIDAIYHAIQDPSAGGIALFVGVVRDHADGRAVARLDYEHHPTMAEKELRSVLSDVAERFAPEGVRLAASHRVGSLSVGDLAVVVGASAPHRDAAFRACRDAIDTIKERVPIWKHEWEPSGDAHWVRLDAPEDLPEDPG